eukprot:3820733-Pyramimonas_sp.AAC.1
MDWAAKSLEGGARAAHAFTRLPPAAEVRRATTRGSPHQLVERELEEWKEAWSHHEVKAQDKPPDFGERTELPRMR